MLSVEEEFNLRRNDRELESWHGVQAPSVGRPASKAGSPSNSWLDNAWVGIRRNYGEKRVSSMRPSPPPAPPTRRRPNSDYISRRRAEFQPPFREAPGDNRNRF